VIAKERPFQRAKMMALAAQLESMFSEQTARALRLCDEAIDRNMGDRIIHRFAARRDSMEQCRGLMQSVRKALYCSK
jgi:hypothetical protein